MFLPWDKQGLLSSDLGKDYKSYKQFPLPKDRRGVGWKLFSWCYDSELLGFLLNKNDLKRTI